jgi:hypothetical protein
MDTVIDEPDQEAAVAAHLLQHDSHGETVGSKPSVVSPDEEILAAGVSTITLQTKTLSGAKRKKFIKARKMNEGPWKVEKLPRKTPSFEEKGAA